MTKKTIYVVARGRRPGIYRAWFGEDGAAAQVQGFPGAVYKGFVRPQDVGAWLDSLDEDVLTHGQRMALAASVRAPGTREDETPHPSAGDEERVVIHTDGGAIDNPGPGGYGAVLRFGTHRRELSGGYRMTTNNRMELMACIAALDALKHPRPSAAPAPVVIYSDSRYVVDGMTKGWAERWRRHGWKRTNGETAENVDLWARLLALCDVHDVAFRWIKGHAGSLENERADQLASQAARQEGLPPDTAFEAGETGAATARLL